MKIYLAGPFFNKRERIIINRVYKTLKLKGLTVFAPMEHFVENGENMSNEKWGKAVFQMDVKAIDECDAVVCVYYGMYSDTGTAWELGYAFAKGKPVILVHVNRDKITSVMTANGAMCNLTLQDLKHYSFRMMIGLNTIKPCQK